MLKTNNTVSVIVPVYNAQRFLKKCITSIMKQTYTDLQIILIDDGSTDKSLGICKKFAKKDNRILVLSQNNKGVSAARNYGMKYMTGKYLTFVDADDWLPKDSIYTLVESLEKNNAQFIVGSMYILFPTYSSKEDIMPLIVCSDEEQEISAKNFFSYPEYYTHVAKKIQLTDIVKKFHITFPEGIKCGEDCYFMLEYIMHCDKLISISDVVYYHNRLYDNTGSTKYYANHHITSEQVLEKYSCCIKKYFCITAIIDELITRRGLYTCNKISMQHIENSTSKEECYQRVKETFGLFERFIATNYIDNNKNNDEVKKYLRIKQNIADNKDMFSSDALGKGNVCMLRCIKDFIKGILAQIKYVWLFRICIKSKI